MDLPLNHNSPAIMHIDLNSCFATCAQQANPLLRGKPVVVAAYTTPNGCVVSPSIEAKNIGEWFSWYVGIGTNRFLAKLAAGLHKPDGLDTITHKNLHAIYERLTLLDLCGINTRYQARLNAAGIFTPLDFLSASPLT